MTNVWIFTTGTSPAYDETQTNSDIQDGDVLIVPDEGVVGIMFYAWPTALTAESGAFHTFVENRDIELNQVGVDNSDRFPIEDKHLEGIETAEQYMLEHHGWKPQTTLMVIDHDKLSEPGNFRILSPIGISER